MCQYFKILKVNINLAADSVCVGKIALFSKFWSAGRLERFANVCNVGRVIFHFSFGKHFFSIAVSFLALQVMGCSYTQVALRSTFLSACDKDSLEERTSQKPQSGPCFLRCCCDSCSLFFGSLRQSVF
jgi:hypothetical protein